MNLNSIYKAEKFAGLKRLADMVDANPKFLWQCATGRRTPSPLMAARLCAADKRLSLDELRGVPLDKMNLKRLHELEGTPGLEALARKVGTSPKYLYQCATGPRMPSPAMAWRLCEADPRLVFEELFDSARPKPKRKAKGA